MSGGVGSRAARGVIWVIELYRSTVSPLRLPSCRFTPTCSQYAVDALGAHGLLRGGWLAVVRLLKCGPWHGGGWDPIPERGDAAAVWRGDADDHRDNPVAGTVDQGGQIESETRV